MTRHIEQLLERIRAWGSARDDVRALLLVGSQARGEAGPESDVDIVIVTTTQSSYLEDTSWVSRFGRILSVQLEEYPSTTSVRASYDGGIEVEFGIAPPDWISPPFDSGTLKVVRGGIRVLFDREGHATELAATAGTV